MQQFPESSSAKKKNVDIDIFVTSTNGESIKTTRRLQKYGSKTNWASSDEHVPQ